ncbi:hypothetical protein DMN91_004378, partial [Ooceraea biroi]
IKMPILYSVVARGTIILAKHAACVGNFEEVTAKILAKIPPDNDKLTYSQGPYLFHYICEDRLIYMCITDDDFQRSRAFLYLNEIKRRFLAVYGPGAQTAVAYAMNTEFARVLANEMKHYSESKDLDRLSQVHGELDELKDIMSVTFRKTSRNLARSLFWKNVKIYVIVAAILILMIYVIVSISCGGMAWQNCVGK